MEIIGVPGVSVPASRRFLRTSGDGASSDQDDFARHR
jgi:hypothetical protein